jgi:Protein of unknown function (DUF1573)
MRKHTISLGVVAVLSVAVFIGCKSTGEKPETKPAIPQTAPTNQPPPVIAQRPDSGDNMASNILAWDATEKVYHAKAGESRAPFTFNLTNVSSSPVMIYDTSTTCDCTVASLPSKPWILQSGEAGKIEATIDLSKKTGVVTNSIIVFTSQGNRRLWVEAIPAGSQAQ